MNIKIEQQILERHNLDDAEFLLLYLITKGYNLKDVSDNLIAKGFADRDLFSNGNIVISDNIKELVSTIIIDSDASVINKDSEFYDLAEAMQEIYPKGRKAGTTYQWRGAKAEIAKKLKTLVAKYKVNLNKEDVLQATRRYVNSFNGNYTKMRLLKYFILKNTLDAEGNAVFNSELLSLLENEEVEENDDWTTELV